MFIPHYLGLVRGAEQQLHESFQVVADRHYNEYEVREMCKQLAGWSEGHLTGLMPLVDRLGEEISDSPQKLRGSLFGGSRLGSLGLLRDLQDLGTLANAVVTNYTILIEAAMTTKDKELEEMCISFRDQSNQQLEWICNQIKVRSPQTLTVPPDLDSEAVASVPEKLTLTAIPDQVWGPLASGGLILAVGAISTVIGQLWLFPSLGPSAYLIGEMPAHPSARFYNTVLGHAIGLVAGFAAVLLFGAMDDPVALTEKVLTSGRALAAALALALTLLFAFLARASHPPAGATTLLVALGSIKTQQDAFNLMVGVFILALLGEALRRLRIGKATRVEAEPRLPAKGAGTHLPPK